MSIQTLPATLTKIPMPRRITRIHSGVELFMVEDVQGHVMAYAQNARMARLIFAAPGLLTAMERLGETTQSMLMKIQEGSKEMNQQAILDTLQQVLEDANTALVASLAVTIEDERVNPQG